MKLDVKQLVFAIIAAILVGFLLALFGAFFGYDAPAWISSSVLIILVGLGYYFLPKNLRLKK